MANVNASLTAAKNAKKDKFYTRLTDIQNELYYYRELFRDKVVLCNCDDPYESWFFKHFAASFNGYGLKKLITTSYADSPIAGTEIVLDGFADKGKKAFIFEVTELKDWNGDGREDLDDVEFAIQNGIYKCTELFGDDKYCAGDFRSKECVDLLPQADIVVTNPPFSVFREYVTQLIQFNKKFLIIGNKNAITYKEIFPLIKENKLWIGCRSINSDMWFMVPEGEPYEKTIDGENVKHIMGCWFTNLDNQKRYDTIPLFRSYYENPEMFPRYDNYDAINVDKVSDIPCDYEGIMGVPITFLDKYSPKQFEIIGLATGRKEFGISPTKRYKNTLQHNVDGTISNGSKVNTGPTILFHDKPEKIYYTADNAEGFLKVLYARVLIRRRREEPPEEEKISEPVYKKMFELKVKSEFEAAHFIKGYAGKCARLHGHNWVVEAIVQGETLNELGILIDFKDLKDALNKVLDEFDHQYLNELEIFADKNPTAEIIAKEIFDRLVTAEIFNGAAKLKGVTVYESPKSSVTYFPNA